MEMWDHLQVEQESPAVGLDMGTFMIKGVLLRDGTCQVASHPTAGEPLQNALRCLNELLEGHAFERVGLGITGANSHLLARELGLETTLEMEALVRGLRAAGMDFDAVFSLGHENMYYLELGPEGTIEFFNRNGQCAAGSGAFWYQQATRMGFDDRSLAELALTTDSPVRISGRCAIFAKSDMTHAINEGATQATVAAGLAETLAEMIVAGVSQNRALGRSQIAAIGGVANNQAVLRYLKHQVETGSAQVHVPQGHEFVQALGAACSASQVATEDLDVNLGNQRYRPVNPLPQLDPHAVKYLPDLEPEEETDTSTVYMGVDCGSVSTKCVLLDADGKYIGGVYLPTSGRPVLQVLELMRRVEGQYGHLLEESTVVGCTTGSGRFLSQKILNTEYAVDEITCQGEAARHLFPEEKTFSIIEIGGEDAKFIQIRDGTLYDYNMNPVCAAGTGTFLENLAGLLGVSIKGEFSRRAFEAEYAIDLGDTCTLLSQSVLVAAASEGLPLPSQLASLAYSSARNYLSKTAENRSLQGRLVFTGATAKNHALASAFAREVGSDVHVPPSPELTGAFGAALLARRHRQMGREGKYSFRSLKNLSGFERTQRTCRAKCEHDHRCHLDVITFSDGSSVLYGDRCGRYSGLERERALEYTELPDYLSERNEIFYRCAGDPLEDGPTVGIARGGMFYDLYPFFAGFFRRLGARVVLSPETTDEILAQGKRYLEADMCYPIEVLVGHYHQLFSTDLDFVFLPEVVDIEPLPWAQDWPRGFTCPLIQTIRGTTTGSLDPDPQRVLYAQLNFRLGRSAVREQMRSVAQRILGEDFSDEVLREAAKEGFSAQDAYRARMREEGRRAVEGLDDLLSDDLIAAVFLGRSYTIYDEHVSKGSLTHARQRGVVALPQEYLLSYVEDWYEGGVDSDLLGDRQSFRREFDGLMDNIDHMYPAQLQRMLSAAFIVSYLNQRRERRWLNTVLQDPFKCGPNAMLRHFLAMVSPSLRLTMDEHTAPAGMITRLEAFRNTVRARREYEHPVMKTSATSPLGEDMRDRRILIPEPTPHARMIAAMLRCYGLQAEVLPRSTDSDLTLARRVVNGEECLPLIQNVQDFLEYLQVNGETDNLAFFQGWASGPCRYGLYAPTQSLILNKLGYGEGRVMSVKLADTLKMFGLGFAVGLYDGMLALDTLYKLLHSTRPYELEPGQSDDLFKKYIGELEDLVSTTRVKYGPLVAGRHIRDLEDLIRRAGRDFRAVPRSDEDRPRIAVAGEFYVRLDDRCNQDVVAQIERAGGEVSLSPATELFLYTAYINDREAAEEFGHTRQAGSLVRSLGFRGLLWLARRDEKRMDEAAGLSHDEHEPSPQEIAEIAEKYVSPHYGGEPPMTIGRTCALARRGFIDGAVMVAPFTCMPGSVVEAQLGQIRKDFGLPVCAVYYDGRDNANRDEFIEGLVFQAKANRQAIKS